MERWRRTDNVSLLVKHAWERRQFCRSWPVDHSRGVEGQGLFVDDLNSSTLVQEIFYMVADFSA